MVVTFILIFAWRKEV